MLFNVFYVRISFIVQEMEKLELSDKLLPGKNTMRILRSFWDFNGP